MRGWLLLALLAVPGWANAETLREERFDVEGEILIDQQGAVSDCDIKTMLPPELKARVVQAVHQWRFHPVLVDGQPAFARSRMRLALLSAAVEQGDQLTLERVRFVGSRVSQMMLPPRYPREAMLKGLSASVLVAARVDGAGGVVDAVAVEAVLRGAGGAEKEAATWLRQFELASLEAARRWKFWPADVQAGEQADITLLVPVDYCAPGGPCRDFQEGWKIGAGVARPAIPWLGASAPDLDAEGLAQGWSIALDSQVRLLHEVEGAKL